MDKLRRVAIPFPMGVSSAMYLSALWLGFLEKDGHPGESIRGAFSENYAGEGIKWK